MNGQQKASYSVPRLCDMPGAHLLPKDLQIEYTREIVWNITNECNANCPHCYANARTKAPDEVTTAEAKEIVDKIADDARKKGETYCICWAGGEPLMREDIFELMSYAKSKGIYQHIVTNGTLVDASVARKMKEAGIKFTCFSLDSFNSETHDRLKGKGSHAKALNAIRECLKAGIYQVPLCVITKNNIDEMEDFRKRCLDEFGCEPYFDRLVGIGRAKGQVYSKHALSKEQFKKMYERRYSKIRDYIKDGKATQIPVMELFDLVPFMDSPANLEDSMFLSWGVGCQACRFWLGLNYNGDVWPCFRLPQVIGNLKKQTLHEIESTEMFQRIQNRTGKRGKCADCEHVALCGGGCLSDTLGMTGDMFNEYPYCWYEPKARSHAARSSLHAKND